MPTMIAVKRHRIEVLLQGFFVLVSIGIGRAVVETQAIQAGPSVIMLALAGGAVAVAVMLMGPVACIAAIAALTVLPRIGTVSVGSDVDLLAADAFFGALVCWWLLHTAERGAQRVDRRPPVPLAGGPVLIFLAYVGLSLLYIAIVDPEQLSLSFVSWLRLLQTACLAG